MDFLPAPGKKRRRGRQKTKLSFSDKLKRTDLELNVDSWIGGFQESLLEESRRRQVKEILCLGLGSPSDSLPARAQLALLLHLQKTLNLVCLFSDPMSSPIYPYEGIPTCTPL